MPLPQNDKSNLRVERTLVSGRIVVIVSGRMDAENASVFEDECMHCLTEGQTTLVAELSGLAYISSIGLRSFISVAKALQSKGGTLRLSGMKGLVKQVFEITGLLQIFSVYDSLESAVL